MTETAAIHDPHRCGACFREQHAGHDVGWRHEDGRLYSATCHDCQEVYRARSPDSTDPMITDPVRTPYGEAPCADDWLLRDAVFDRVGEVYTDDIIAIVRDWLATYERVGCSIGDAQAELELE